VTATTAVERAPTLSLSCTGCGAIVDVEQGMRTAACVYCDTPGVIEKPRGSSVPEPTFVLPFIVGKDQALKALAHWKKTRSIFCRSAIRSAAASATTVESMRGIYVPAYLYSCVATSSYSAQIGENYTETETYTTTVNGKSVTRTRTVTKTEWRALSGNHQSYVNDVVVTASKGIPNDELERIEPFDLRGLRRMDASVLPGWIAEEASLERDACLQLARQEAVDEVKAALEKFMPGDSHNSLTSSTSFDREGADLVLVPIWVLALRWSNQHPVLRILINGESGRAGGDAPLSPLKITLAIVAALAAIGAGVLVWYGRQRHWW
jgi:predicted nucleic acid-binding Zn ribbon protein